MDTGQQVSISNHVYSGNRCGHNPANPNWFIPPKTHKMRYDVLRWAQANIQQFYIAPSKWLKSLRYARESSRQQRSEARERDGKVIQVLLHHCELVTLRVGTPHLDGTFDSLSMKDIALRAGWRTVEDDKSELPKEKDKAIKRVWRALNSLKDAGYITIHECVEKVPDGEEEKYRGLPAVKCINPKLFWELGITKQKLYADRKLATERWKKKQAAYRRKAAVPSPQDLTPLAFKKPSYLQGRRDYYAYKRKDDAKKRMEDQYKQRHPELYALREQYPHLTPDELLALANSPPKKNLH